MSESDAPKNSIILAMVIGTIGALIVVVLGIAQFFDMSVRTEIEEKVLSQQSSALRDLRAAETSKLTRYAWIDQKKGEVQLPVDRAAELVVADWDKRPAGLVQGIDPAPAPASAPNGSAPAAPTSTPSQVPGALPPGAPATAGQPGGTTATRPASPTPTSAPATAPAATKPSSTPSK